MTPRWLRKQRDAIGWHQRKRDLEWLRSLAVCRRMPQNVTVR